jgi:hypothetical protein
MNSLQNIIKDPKLSPKKKGKTKKTKPDSVKKILDFEAVTSSTKKNKLSRKELEQDQQQEQNEQKEQDEQQEQDQQVDDDTLLQKDQKKKSKNVKKRKIEENTSDTKRILRSRKE